MQKRVNNRIITEQKCYKSSHNCTSLSCLAFATIVMAASAAPQMLLDILTFMQKLIQKTTTEIFFKFTNDFSFHRLVMLDKHFRGWPFLFVFVFFVVCRGCFLTVLHFTWCKKTEALLTSFHMKEIGRFGFLCFGLKQSLMHSFSLLNLFVEFHCWLFYQYVLIWLVVVMQNKFISQTNVGQEK